jgi:hypothetical protein
MTSFINGLAMRWLLLQSGDRKAIILAKAQREQLSLMWRPLAIAST